jgi:hypothetical protein
MQSTPAPEKAAPRHAPIALWRLAQAFLQTLHMLFGAPEDVARADMMTRKSHALLLSWLRTAEALMRRLLLIEAAAYAGVPAAPVRTTGRDSVRERRLFTFTPEAPEQWRVSFHCFEPAHSARRAARSERPPSRNEPRRLLSAWPLAERYEALIRVFNDPGAAARRLARRLCAAPHRLAEVLRAPPEARHRIDNFAALTEHAEQAHGQSPNTS